MSKNHLSGNFYAMGAWGLRWTLEKSSSIIIFDRKFNPTRFEDTDCVTSHSNKISTRGNFDTIREMKIFFPQKIGLEFFVRRKVLKYSQNYLNCSIWKNVKKNSRTRKKFLSKFYYLANRSSVKNSRRQPVTEKLFLKFRHLNMSVRLLVSVLQQRDQNSNSEL